MSILNFIFGKKKTVNDSVLGVISSERTRNASPNKSCTWYASYLIPNAPEDSSIIMQGNFIKPSTNQLNEIKGILNNLELLYTKVDEKLNGELQKIPIAEREIFRNWKSNFYLAAIHPLELNTKLHFEISFDPMDDKSDCHMTFSYRNGILQEMDSITTI